MRLTATDKVHRGLVKVWLCVFFAAGAGCFVGDPWPEVGLVLGLIAGGVLFWSEQRG